MVLKFSLSLVLVKDDIYDIVHLDPWLNLLLYNGLLQKCSLVLLLINSIIIFDILLVFIWEGINWKIKNTCNVYQKHLDLKKRIKIENKEADTVNKVFKNLKDLLGYEKFHELFPIILTDNGVEFSKPDDIEFNGYHVYKTKVFYCDPGHSEQKGKIENNHEYIRRFIPKGTSFDNYNQDDINLMMNHINSVKRDSLSGCNTFLA